MEKTIYWLVIRWSETGHQYPEYAFSERSDAEAFIHFFNDDDYIYTIEKITCCDRKLPF